MEEKAINLSHIATLWGKMKTYVAENASNPEVFYAEYGKATYQEILDAVNAGKLVFTKTTIGGSLRMLQYVSNYNNTQHYFYCTYGTNSALTDSARGYAIVNKSNDVWSAGYVSTGHQSLAGKQDVIDDLETIRSGAALGATAIQNHQSLAGYATESFVNEKIGNIESALTSLHTLLASI